MENYKVELIFYSYINYPSYCYDSPRAFDDIVKHLKEDYKEIFSADTIPMRSIVYSGNFKASQFQKKKKYGRHLFDKKYWNQEYQSFCEKHIPKIYSNFLLKPKKNWSDETCGWKFIFSDYNIKCYLNLDVELLKRSPKVIFKKVFANIVLKSLLSDIYKPGSKRFRKCQKRFLENSSLIVRDELKT